ncbi:hypothetical protein BKA70DRAFT_1440932 [Coprinopsis sp. MPI-PUGE-AT-0042]|nr:hypothetical protein BKA70DRAFT_1440932 [Coprinopsis sp. MPI-PUGE-AT-0042]
MSHSRGRSLWQEETAEPTALIAHLMMSASALTDTPKGFDLATSFVKTATSTILILVLIVACKEKETNSGAIGKLLSSSSSPHLQTATTRALHASPSSSIVFASGKSIINHLKTLTTELTNLAEPQDLGAAAAPAPSRRRQRQGHSKEEEVAKIEGAV